MKVNTQRSAAMALFFLSGVISLIFQVVWLKKLVLVFGNTVWAVSTLLTAFMAGLALGSWLFGRLADRTGSPLKLYGLLEGVIGSYGVLSLFLFSQLPILYIPLYQMSGGDTLMMGMLKFLLAFAILILPTTCMGGTLPLLAKQFTRRMDTAGSSIGLLYTVNTFGAVFGTCLSGFVLIPVFGLRLTALSAAAISFLITVVAFWLAKGEQIGLRPKSVFAVTHRRLWGNWVLWVYVLCGFAALSYEVIWNRILVLHIGSSVYAYSMMLAIYLAGVTLGSAIMSGYINKIRRPALVLLVIQLTIAFDLLLLINQFSDLAETLFVMRTYLGADHYFTHILSLAIGVLQILILPTVLFGASFPLAIKLFVKEHSHLGQETGVLYAFNTVGNILGSFCAGFLLLPLLGAQHGLLLTASLNLGIGLYLLTKVKFSSAAKVVAATLAVLLFYGGYHKFTFKDQVIVTAGAFLAMPDSRTEVKILTFLEDIYATITVEERKDVRGTWQQLSMNAVSVAGTSSELFSIQKLQGHLPLLLHHNPKSVLHIGFGSGGTAYAVSQHPVDKITIAEISKGIIETSSAYFKDINHGVLNDPRVKVEFTDGRNKVLASREKFDVILSDSIHPRFSGNGSLYTYEYYSLLKDRLNPGGVVSQWLPFYSLTTENFKMIIKSFYDVFPNTTIWFTNSTLNSYVIVTGKLGDPKIDYARMEAGLRIPGVNADLKEIHTETPYKLLDYFLFANDGVKAFVGDVSRHTDDNMAVEYLSGRALSPSLTSRLNLTELLKFRTSVQGSLDRLDEAIESKDDILNTLDRYETATTHNLAGQRLFWEGKRTQAFNEFEQIPALNPDDMEPVEYFGSSYQQPFLQHAAFPQE